MYYIDNAGPLEVVLMAMAVFCTVAGLVVVV